MKFTEIYSIAVYLTSPFVLIISWLYLSEKVSFNFNYLSGQEGPTGPDIIFRPFILIILLILWFYISFLIIWWIKTLRGVFTRDEIINLKDRMLYLAQSSQNFVLHITIQYVLLLIYFVPLLQDLLLFVGQLLQ